MLATQQRRPSPRGRHPNRLFRLLRPNGAVIVLGMLLTLALVECLAAFLAYRERLSAQDWAEIDALITARASAEQAEEPLIVASEWLAPAARMQLPAARSWASLAYPDLRYESFWVLTHMLERPWAGPLNAELEELPRPQLAEVHRAGELTLRRYVHATGVGARTFSLIDSVEGVSTGRGTCSAGRSRWTCKDGRLAVATVEVDYRPRRCLAVELDDGVVAEVELGEVDLGEELRGHVGFGDFNARLRADPTARIELLVDEVVVGRWLFSDDQGWAAFALRTEPGRRHVQLRASTSVGGTWQRGGHRGNPTDTLCVELRGFRAGTTGGEEEGG